MNAVLEQLITAWSAVDQAVVEVTREQTVPCPKCHETGMYGTRGKCFYCHGAARFLKREQQEAIDLPNLPRSLNAEKLYKAFQAAKANGIQSPTIQMDHIAFKPAPVSGRNPNAIYVSFKVRGEANKYLGKIDSGRFYPSNACDLEKLNKVLEILEDPFKAVKAYGLKSGICGCCGRMLTNGESIRRGIGPICAEKYGWSFSAEEVSQEAERKEELSKIDFSKVRLNWER